MSEFAADFLERLEDDRVLAAPQLSAQFAKMLPDGKIDSLDTHLEQFKFKNQTNQNELQVVLREYSQLLEDYKALKKAYEGKVITNGLKVSINEPHNPYVLVLVDGNGYIFNNEFVMDKEEGGMKAARMLNEVVEKYLRENNIPAPRVVVRVYADLTGLSKSLAKTKLVGLEKRSLAAFAAGFTRAINLFDFVDALDEEGTKFKIREMFKHAAEDASCSHILYAACHDTSYLAQLVPYSGLRNKITLVQGAGFSSEFHQFSLNVTQFPTIFRWSELASTAPSAKSSTVNSSDRTAVPQKPQKAFVQPNQNHVHPRRENSWRNDAFEGETTFGADEVLTSAGHAFPETNGWGTKPENNKQPSKMSCRFWQKGFCKNGNKCNFLHTTKAGVVNEPKQQHQQIINGIDRSMVASSLPTSTVPGFIPLNKNDQRIDTYVKAPTQEEWAIYNRRFHRQKPCNEYHLRRICTSFNCPFDHHDLEPEARHALEYVLRCSPCPRKSACRISDCFYGHLCQKDDCTGQMKGCKMKADMHQVDPKLASMVPSVDEDLLHDGTGDSDGTFKEADVDATWY